MAGSHFSPLYLSILAGDITEVAQGNHPEELMASDPENHNKTGFDTVTPGI